MKRTFQFVAVFAPLLLLPAVGFAQGPAVAQPKLAPVPEASLPAQRNVVPAQQQPVPAQPPAAAQKPVPAQPVPAEQATIVAPELLIGRWDINVDSYLDMRLQRKGRYEDPAKVAYARNLLKTNGMNVRLDFQADGRMGVAKTYCGECEAKTGSWCVTCVEGQQMTVEVRSKHGWSRRNLDLVVCDDLRIRVLAPTEIAGIYERVPDSVQDTRVQPQTPIQPQSPGSVSTTERLPPEPAPTSEYDERPVEGKADAGPVVPQKASPGVTDEIAP